MPASETPTNPPPIESPGKSRAAVEDSPFEEARSQADDSSDRSSGYSTSRYVDYDAHELLDRISRYEDERRWQRIREGIWISIIAHILFFSALTWIPRYILHQPQIVDPFQAMRDRKYLDELPEALKQLQKAKPKLPPLKPNQNHVDQKTLEALRKLEESRPKPPEPQVAQDTPQPQPAPQPETPQPLTSTAPPQPNPPLAFETPRPAPVPARPNFSFNQPTTADQLRDAMRKSMQEQSGVGMNGPSLNRHSGAAGGAEILSDTKGVNFDPWLQKVIRETYRTWDPLIPEEVNPPILKQGQCEIVFTVLPNGRLQPQSMMLTGRSGDIALDRAAWGGIVGADYPPLPREFTGPYIQLRFRFQYNVK